MIEIFEGRPGGFKTYNAVLRICDALRRGQTVVTNVRVYREKVFRYVLSTYGYWCDPAQLVALEDWTAIREIQKHTPRGTADCHVLVVIDEAHVAHNCRETLKQQKETLDWFSVHRHDYVDLIFISQHAEKLDKQLRLVAQFYWRFRDMQKVSILGVNYPLNQYSFGKYDYDGKTLMERGLLFKDAAVYRLYASESFNSVYTGQNVRGRTGEKVRGKAAYMKIVLIGVLAVGVLCWSIYYFWHKVKSVKLPSGVMRPAAAVVAGPVVSRGSVVEVREVTGTCVSRSGRSYCLLPGFGWVTAGDVITEMGTKGLVVACGGGTATVLWGDGRRETFARRVVGLLGPGNPGVSR